MHVADGRRIVFYVASVLKVRLSILLSRVGKVKKAALQLALGRQDDRLHIVLVVRLNLLDSCSQALSDRALAYSKRRASNLLLLYLIVLYCLGTSSMSERQFTVLAALVDVHLAGHLRVVEDFLEQSALLARVRLLLVRLSHRRFLTCGHVSLELDAFSSSMPRYLVRFFGARLLTDEAGRSLVRGSRCHKRARVLTS